MNIKSILFGSAAALVAVSGARAADAVVVAEPEPMEYVRICDTYGAGFYYIPGTETCLRISGLIRYEIDADNFDDEFSITFEDWDSGFINVFGDEGGFFDIDGLAWVRDSEDDLTVTTSAALDDGWAKSATARVNFDARSETEYGTFRRFIRISGQNFSGGSGGGISIEYAYIELGGLLVGYYDTLYDGDLIPEFDSAGGSASHQIRYTWNGASGFSVAGSLEVDSYNSAAAEYVPNLVANVGFTQGWGSIRGWVAYDAVADEVAVKGIASFNATDAITLQAMVTYESGSSAFSVSSGWQSRLGGFAKPFTTPFVFPFGSFTWPGYGGGYEWSFAGAAAFKVSDRLTISGGGQYFLDSHNGPFGFFGGSDDYRVGGQIDFTPVPDLLTRLQVHYNGGDSQDFWDARFRVESTF